MKRFATLIAILLFTAAVFGQEPATRFRTRMFELHNRNARDVYAAVRTLGSGVSGSDLNFNNETRTISVRDYPENIAAIEEAIGRLDKPAPAAPDVELKISLLIGSKTALPGPAVPDDLAPVVKQLQATLRYSYYGLLAANIHHTRAGDGVEGSGVAESTLVGLTASPDTPVFYNYRLRNIAIEQGTDRPSVGVQNVSFQMKVPVRVEKNTTYQSVGFETPITIREGEKLVIGTTTMGERAVIVVLTASIGGK